MSCAIPWMCEGVQVSSSPNIRILTSAPQIAPKLDSGTVPYIAETWGHGVIIHVCIAHPDPITIAQPRRFSTNARALKLPGPTLLTFYHPQPATTVQEVVKRKVNLSKMYDSTQNTGTSDVPHVSATQGIRKM